MGMCCTLSFKDQHEIQRLIQEVTLINTGLNQSTATQSRDEQNINIQYADEELGSLISDVNDAAESEAFDGVMYKHQELKQVVQQRKKILNGLSITDKIMELSASTYVQGLPLWTREMVMDTTCELFQQAMVNYSQSVSKSILKRVERNKFSIQKEMKDGWLKTLSKCKDGQSMDIVFFVDILEEGINLLDVKKEDVIDAVKEKSLEIAIAVISSACSGQVDSKLFEAGFNLIFKVAELAKTQMFKQTYIKVVMLNQFRDEITENLSSQNLQTLISGLFKVNDIDMITTSTEVITPTNLESAVSGYLQISSQLQAIQQKWNWYIAFASLNVIRELMRKGLLNDSIIQFLRIISINSKSYNRQRVVELCTLGLYYYYEKLGSMSQQNELQKQVFIKLLKKFENQVSNQQNLMNLEENECNVQFNGFQQVILLMMTQKQNIKYINIVLNPEETMQKERLQTKPWKEWMSGEQKQNNSREQQIQAILEQMKISLDRQDELYKRLDKVQEEQKEQIKVIDKLLGGIGAMQGFIDTFKVSISTMQESINNISLSIDRIAEVNCGRDVDKLAQHMIKYFDQMSQEQSWKNNLQYYVPEKGIINMKSLDVDEFVKEVIRSNLCESTQQSQRRKNSILIHGGPGTGKSVCTQHLVDDIYRASIKSKAFIIPLFVNLNLIGAIKASGDLIQAIFCGLLGFSQAEINSIKYKQTKYHILLILDGYDEIFNNCKENIYVQNQLETWNCIALVIFTCRTQLLQTSAMHFTTFANCYEEYQEIELLPFDDKQIEQYLDKYLKQYTFDIHNIQSMKLKYLEKIDTIPGLKELIKNPLIYSMIIEILPQIVDKLNGGQITRIMKIHIYELFIKMWFDNEMKKCRIILFQNSCLKYAQNLAAEMMKNQSIVIDSSSCFENKWNEFFDPDVLSKKYFYNELLKDSKLCFKVIKNYIPFQGVNNKYKFFHKSIQEYFAACNIVDEVTNIIHFISSQQFENRIYLTRSVLPQIDTPMNKYHIRDVGEISFLCELIWCNKQFMQDLFCIIKSTKESPSLQQAAANAITLLNCADVSFNCMDLSEIRIKGANLSLSSCIGTNFCKANLQGVEFLKADLRNANIQDAIFSDVSFGQWADIIGHNNPINAVCVSKDGKFLGSGGEDCVVKYWDFENGKEISSHNKHTRAVLCVQFNPDSTILASGSMDGSIILQYLNIKNKYISLVQETCAIRCISFSKNGKLLVSGRGDGSINVWDVSQATLICKLTGHGACVSCIAFSHDNNVIYSGSWDKSIKMWEIQNKKCIKTYEYAHQSCINCICLTKDESHLISAGDDLLIKLTNTKNETEFTFFSGQNGSISCMALSHDGKYLVSGSTNQSIILWDISSQQQIKQLSGHIGAVSSIVFSCNNQLISCGEDKSIKIWDPTYNMEIKQQHGHLETISCLAISPDSKILLSGSNDETIKVWDCTTQQVVNTLKNHNDFINCIDIRKCNTEMSIKVIQGEQNQAKINKDDTIAVSCGKDKKIILWNVLGQEIYQETISCQFEVKQVKFYSNYIIYSADEWICFYDFCKRTQCHKIHEKLSMCFDISTDGTLIIGCQDGSIAIYEMTTQNCIQKLEFKKKIKAHAEQINSIVFNHNYQFFASCSADASLKMWRVANYQQICNFVGHQDSVTCIDFSVDDKYIVTGSMDRTIRLWDSMTNDNKEYQ